jgi:hypothetical protein
MRDSCTCCILLYQRIKITAALLHCRRDEELEHKLLWCREMRSCSTRGWPYLAPAPRLAVRRPRATHGRTPCHQIPRCLKLQEGAVSQVKNSLVDGTGARFICEDDLSS